MSIFEYFAYGLICALAGGGAIGLSLSLSSGDSAGPWLLVGGVIFSTVGTVLGSIGVIAKGVEVGTR